MKGCVERKCCQRVLWCCQRVVETQSEPLHLEDAMGHF